MANCPSDPYGCGGGGGAPPPPPGTDPAEKELPDAGPDDWAIYTIIAFVVGTVGYVGGGVYFAQKQARAPDSHALSTV